MEYDNNYILGLIIDSYLTNYHKGFARFACFLKRKCKHSGYIIAMITGSPGIGVKDYDKLNKVAKRKVDAFIDFALSKDTYDVTFNCCLCCDSKGFSLSYQECLDWIKEYNGTDHSYFGTYRKGQSTVGIYSNLLKIEVYEAEIK